MQKYSITKSLGGMNFDDEVRFIPAGDYLSATNLRTAITEGGKMGTQTSVKGNWLITQYNCPYTDTFPQPVNKTIGYCEDIKNNSIIFFNWNSNGEHGIYRFWRDRIDANNPYGVCDQIVSYDFGWKETDRITSANIVYGETGDLLYWTDSVMPRKINLTKGNLVGKKKSWDLYLPVTCALPSLIYFTFKNKAGGIIYTVGQVLLDPNNRAESITKIAESFNANTDSPVTAEACECHLKFTEKVAGGIWTVTVDTGAIMIVPDNWYGSVLIDRYFDRCKYPFLEAPLMEFKIDDKYNPNYVRNKVFQSRLQPYYDDNEGTTLALGVWSQIPINNLGCDGTSSPQYNYIDIDFNDTSIANEQTLVLLKKISLIMREHNSGTDRRVISLNPCDFLDYDYTPNAEKWVVHYKFYNDIISSPIDTATAAKLFDDVPLKSNAQLYVKNKVVDGGILEGYNAPDCIDAKPQMEFGDTPNPQVHKVTGLIRVFNYRLDNNASLPPEPTEPNILERRGAVSYDTAMQFGGVSYPFFGGYWEKSSALTINTDFAFNKKRQYLPEGGWTVYAAGKEYFTISKQRSINGVAQRADGSFDVSTTVNKDLVKAVYDATDPQDVYSTFELNLPDGEYVIRLASHWCSFGDKLQKGFMYDLSAGNNYQKTSTYVWGINDYPLGGGYKSNYEIKVVVSGADVFIGEFIIADLVFPNISDDSKVYPSHSGYLYDNFGKIDVPSLSQGITVDRALVRNTVFNESDIYASYQQKITDHNGYFFTFPDEDFNSGGYANRFKAIEVSGEIHNTGTQYYEDVDGKSALSLLLSQTITTTYPHSPIPSHLEIILPTDNPNGRLESSTIINGKVTDTNTNPIVGASVLVTHGKYTNTQIDGSYSIIVWGDMGQTPPFTPPISIRADYLVFSLSVACGGEYPNGQEVFFTIYPFGANTTTTPPPYSPTAIYDSGIFILNEINNPSIKAHKRGGNYTYGLRLYDNAGRLCSVVKAFDMYVPFITEDIGKYSIENFSGVTYPANTFKYGKPSIKWVLASNTVLPTWATTFQWMRVKNSIYGRYLQWVANQVTYLSATATSSTPEIQTSFQNADAVAIKVSLSNITSYYAANNNSQVGYQYIAGDRLRLIANRSLVNYQGVTDFEITSYDTTTQSVIIKPNGFATEIQSGTLFEIFNPKSVETTDEQTYYEVGEVVGITNGVPDKLNGVFTNGDTYWRGRLIIVNDDATKFASAYPVVIEDASISDFYVSQDQDIGRIGIIDPNFKQVYNPAKLRVSNDYQVSSANNGLSSFEELNQKELDKGYGEIKRLFFVNNNLVVVTQNKEVSNYIGIVTIQQASKGASAGILSTSEQFFGTDYYHSKLLGADYAGSVVFNNNSQLMGYNSRLANVWQYEQDGEHVLSDAKMINYFKGLAGNVTDCVATYDRNYEEYILTIWRDGVPETLAWCDAKKRWTTFYSFTPECYATLGADIYSFQQGAIYIHDKNPTRNLFYFGQQGVSKIKVVFNTEPDMLKVWNSNILKTLQSDGKNNWYAPVISNDNNQLSRLVKGSWIKRGEDWFASYKRNLNDPTVANPIINGNALRSSTLVCELENDFTGEMRLYAFDSNYSLSERTLPK